jgi:hypothetical protein
VQLRVFRQHRCVVVRRGSQGPKVCAVTCVACCSAHMPTQHMPLYLHLAPGSGRASRFGSVLCGRARRRALQSSCTRACCSSTPCCGRHCTASGADRGRALCGAACATACAVCASSCWRVFNRHRSPRTQGGMPGGGAHAAVRPAARPARIATGVCAAA